MSHVSILPAAARFKGRIEGEGDLVVHGSFDGDLRIDGILDVSEGAKVTGNVHATEIKIQGTFFGDAVALRTIRVEEHGTVVGDLTAPRVQVVRGARFRGQVQKPGEHVAIPASSGLDVGADQTSQPLSEPPPKEEAPSSPKPRRPPPPIMPTLARAQARRKEAEL